MELDEIPGSHILLHLAGLVAQVPRSHLRRRHRLLVTAVGLRHRYRHVGLIESRNLVMVGRSGVGLMRGSVGQVQVQHLRPFADQDALPGQGNARRGRVADVRDENAPPDGGALRGFHVLHVKHKLGKALVENSRLDFERRLRALEPVLQPAQGGLRGGREIHRVEHRQGPGGHGKNGNHSQEGPHSDAAGPHGGDFAVRGQAAEADQNSHQHTHGNGVGKSHRQGIEENLQHAGQGRTVAHHQVENVSQVPGEQHKCEHRNADGGVRDHFTQDVAGQNPHATDSTSKAEHSTEN